MSASTNNGLSRRQLLKNSGQVAAATALSATSLPRAYASGDGTIRIALVGCGGRGTGAAANALSTKKGPTKLVAMADVFEDRMKTSYRALNSRFKKEKNKVDVPEERKFIGFDAYKKAMDCLRPGAGDVAIFATPPAFRWVHFTYAIDKGLNVFMEKPTAVDGPAARKMFDLAEKSEKKNLKVGVGLMCRHCLARNELFDRIRDGQVGDLVLLKAARVVGPTGSAFTEACPKGTPELHYQIRNFHAFLWASGGAFSDFLIHNIDECCWMKDDWPVQANGFGGRHYRFDYVDQNFDVYTVEYTYPDGTKLLLEGRCMTGCHQEFASHAFGSKGAAIISTSAHAPARSRIYKGHNFTGKDLAWHFPQPEPSPYQLEWDDLIEAIQKDKPFNEARRGVEASLATAMGRMASHTGQIVTRDEMLHCEHEFAPEVDKLTLASAAPLPSDEDGTYPVPQPGVKKQREY